METLMAVAAKIEILLASIAVGLLITTIALRGMFRAVRPAGAGAVKSGARSGDLAVARVRAGHGQVSLRAS